MRSPSLFIVVLLVLLPVITPLRAQQNSYVSPAGTKFLLYTPPGYSSGTAKHPLLVSLHGKGEVADDLTQLTSNTAEQMPSRLIYLNRWPASLPFIVLTPQLKPTAENPDPQWPADYIDEVVRYVLQHYRVDTSRIYVTGLSRGGTGSWTYASAYPQKVAAMLIIAGKSDVAQACPIKNIPVWVFHGDSDGVVPLTYSTDMLNAINACQPPGVYKQRLNILHSRSHTGWSEIYNGTNGYPVYDWLLQFVKNNNANKPPYVNAGIDRRFRLRSQPLYIVGDFYDWDGIITSVQWRQTAGQALTLSNITSKFLKLTNLKTGTFEFELTVTDDDGVTRSDRVGVEITSPTVTPYITDILLINGKTNLVVDTLHEDQVINKNVFALNEINLRALSSTGTGSVRFSVDTDQNTRTLNTPGPYLIRTQTTAPEWKIANDEYFICATPFAKSGGNGAPGVSLCYKVRFIEPTCPGAGKITQEIWSNITGNTVASIPVGSPPSSTRDLTLFETQTNAANNYGSRVRGYICPPTTGRYTFWISSDDHSELWLSTSSDPANKVRICYVSGVTAKRQWEKYPTQKSVSINLVADQKYYIEALHKEASGGDHLAVGWQLVDGTLERPILGSRLIPFGTGTSSARVANADEQNESNQITAAASTTVQVYPNPWKQGPMTFVIPSHHNTDGATQADVSIISSKGEIVYSEVIPCQGNCLALSFETTKDIAPGIYIVRTTINGKQFSKRIMIY